MIYEDVDKSKRDRTRCSKLLGCLITVAQIKILYTSRACKWQSGDLLEGAAIERSSKQAYINKIISTTRRVYNEALHKIQMRGPRLEKSYELLGHVRALWPVPDRTTWGLFLSLRICPDLSSISYP
jgi:hypothetical protein